MGDMKRITISMSSEIDKKILELKMTEEYCMKSYAEIVRVLLRQALKCDTK